MLKWTLWLLLAANAGYFAWTQGYLGGTPAEQREPHRMDEQIKPEQLRLLNGPKAERGPAAARPATPPTTPSSPSPAAPPAAAPTPAPPSAPAGVDSAAAAAAAPPATDSGGARACWQAGGFTEAQAELLRAELALLGLSPGQWQLGENRSPGRWIVYMGRYDNDTQLERKKAELRALGTEFREVSVTGLAPGLALGTFSSEAAAQQALQEAERSGVRTAKVAQERAESVSFTLRLPAITAAQRAAVDGLGEAMGGRTLKAC